jgi:multiple sugar transport system substrate-binding protein
MRKNVLLAALVVVLILSMTACAPKAQGPVALRFWTHQNPTFEAAFQAGIDAYQAAHPNVTITMETFEYSTYIQTLQTSMPAKEEADILAMFGTWVCGYADRLASAPDNVMTVSQAQDLFYAAPVGGYICDGKLYGMPQEFNIEYGGVLVNKAMFEAAGRTYPPAWTSMDDVLADGAALVQTDASGVMTVAGFDFISSDPVVFSFLAGILQRGGDYWNADKTGLTFNTPEAKAQLEWMVGVVDAGIVDPVLFNDSTNWVGTAFFSGQTAMGYIGPWAVSMGTSDYPDFGEFGYFVLPPTSGTDPIFAADSGWGLSVSPNSANQDVAWDFVKFLTADPANAMQWNITSSTIPAIPANAQSAELANALPWITEELTQLEYGRYMGYMPDRDAVCYQIIYPHILNALQGVETVDEALAAIDAEANATFQ